MLIAARGQTMSVAFYPLVGMVMFGSEQAATKMGMGMGMDDDLDASKSGVFPQSGEQHGAFRLDLDDVGGELLLLHWGAAASQAQAHSPPHPRALRRNQPRVPLSLFHAIVPQVLRQARRDAPEQERSSRVSVLDDRQRSRADSSVGATTPLESYAAAFSEDGGRRQLRSLSAQAQPERGPRVLLSSFSHSSPSARVLHVPDPTHQPPLHPAAAAPCGS